MNDTNTIFRSQDINECYSNNGDCSQTCENNKGSYECGCKSGYELNSDKTSCDGMIILIVYSIMIFGNVID